MRPSLRPAPWLGLGALLTLSATWVGSRSLHVEPPRAPAMKVVQKAAPPPAAQDDPELQDDERAYTFRVPSGEPTSLSCEEARRIVLQVRDGLASPPDAVSPGALATSTSDWLDPHSLWSLAKDAPTSHVLDAHAKDLLLELEGKRSNDCASATAAGQALATWTAKLREAFDRGRSSARVDESAAAANDPLPTGDSGLGLANRIGERVGSVELAMGPEAKPFGDAARSHFFPSLEAEGWSRIVLAAAVRAYVPLVDPHGAWAPFDEESSVYEVDLAARPPSKLWGHVTPTAIGVRVTEDPAAPLRMGDVVLSVAGVATAGLPLEQLEQLGFATTDAHAPTSAIVLREGKIVTMDVGIKDEAAAPGPREDGLVTSRVPYGEGDTLIVRISEVKDDLGDDLSKALARERLAGARPLRGVVIDLRGNGGGSTDGAIGAISLFLPGVPLFPMKRRDGTVEIDRALEPRAAERWDGPVATLVDGATASAAEMIAGALAVYQRGPSVGTGTFGKGCAQEYVDDDAHAGVLRLTTLLYALPDGTAVQRTGLVPTLRVPFVTPTGAGSSDREATLEHAPPAWRGPDVRDQVRGRRGDEVSWPPHAGNVGPCDDADVCRALRALGASAAKRPVIAKGH